MKQLVAPFPYFGGKSRVAHIIWEALGSIDHYVEPFFGSGAVLLARPGKPKLETVNDLDGLLVNFWRSVQHSPDAVAVAASNPVHEVDFHARHIWLTTHRHDITARLMADPIYHDARAAGWWAWGMAWAIGGKWCNLTGPWVVMDGRLVDRRVTPDAPDGPSITRALPSLGGGGNGNVDPNEIIRLSKRLAGVRSTCGSWDRIVGPAITGAGGAVCGVFLDPPYEADMHSVSYAMGKSEGVAKSVREWCAENGGNEAIRIVLTGYDGEHNALEDIGWRVHSWKTSGGYANVGSAGNQASENASKERIWFSPHCQDHNRQKSLF